MPFSNQNAYTTPKTVALQLLPQHGGKQIIFSCHLSERPFKVSHSTTYTVKPPLEGLEKHLNTISGKTTNSISIFIYGEQRSAIITYTPNTVKYHDTLVENLRNHPA